MKELADKNALVTGGGSGIGKAIVEALAERGARVAVHYFTSREPAETLAATIRAKGGDAFAVGADLTDERQVEEMFAGISERFTALHVLVNNTGDLVGRKNLEAIDEAFYRKVMAVNLDSMMWVTRRAIPLLRAGSPSGIVNLSSLAGRAGGAGGSLIYSTTKGAVLAWTRALAKELAPDGIRVNAVAPGLILGSRFHEVHTAKEAQKRAIEGTPLGRAGTCEDVARAVAFLAAEYDGFITGATLDINGGSYMA